MSSTTMAAAVYLGPGRVEVREVPRPEPGPGEVLVRVASTTVCGTDLRIASGAKTSGVRAPVVLGHEVAGTVEAVGAGVDGVDDVAGPAGPAGPDRSGRCRAGCASATGWAWPPRWCAGCAPCAVAGCSTSAAQPGCWATRSTAGWPSTCWCRPTRCARATSWWSPPRVPLEQVSLAEPLSCVLHGQQLVGVGLDDVVLVVGGGAIGQLHAQLARVSGARAVVVSEPVASRRALAARLGATAVVDPTTEDLDAVVSDLSDGAGADVVVVCIGVPALVDQALASARPRGRVSLFAGFPRDRGAEIDPNRIHYGELSVTGSSDSTVEDHRAAVRLIESGRVDVGSLLTDTYPLDRVHDALQRAAEPEAVKVAVLPGG